MKQQALELEIDDLHTEIDRLKLCNEEMKDNLIKAEEATEKERAHREALEAAFSQQMSSGRRSDAALSLLAMRLIELGVLDDMMGRTKS